MSEFVKLEYLYPHDLDDINEIKNKTGVDLSKPIEFDENELPLDLRYPKIALKYIKSISNIVVNDIHKFNLDALNKDNTYGLLYCDKSNKNFYISFKCFDKILNCWRYSIQIIDGFGNSIEAIHLNPNTNLHKYFNALFEFFLIQKNRPQKDNLKLLCYYDH